MSDLARDAAPPMAPRPSDSGLFTGQHPAGGPPLYRQALELARAAEGNGFDTFWASEHHGLADGYLPAPLTLPRRSPPGPPRSGSALPWPSPRCTTRSGWPRRPPSSTTSAGAAHPGPGDRLRPAGVRHVRRPTTPARGARLADLLLCCARRGRVRSSPGPGPAYRAPGCGSPRPRPARPGSRSGWAATRPRAVRRAGELADGHLIGRGDPEIVDATSAQLQAVRDPADPTFTVGVNLLVALAGTLAHDRRGPRGLRRTSSRSTSESNATGTCSPDTSTRPTETDGPLDAERTSMPSATTDEVARQVRRALEPLRQPGQRPRGDARPGPPDGPRAQLARLDRLGGRVLPRCAIRDPSRTQRDVVLVPADPGEQLGLDGLIHQLDPRAVPGR